MFRVPDDVIHEKMLLGVVVILLLSQCKKDHLTDTTQAAELTVAAFTETGANTFGAYLNGMVWANFGYLWVKGPYGSPPAHNEPNVVTAGSIVNSKGDSLYFISARLTVTKNGEVGRDESISLKLPKSHNIKGVHQLVTADYMFGYDLGSRGYYSLIRSPFTVNVYQDTVIGSKHIISGKFKETLYGYVFPGVAIADSVKVTGGVFDVTTDN